MSNGVNIRVQSSQGTALFTLKNLDETYGALRTKIEEKWEVPIENQILSHTPFANPKIVEAGLNTKLRYIGCEHGCTLYLSLPKKKLDVASKVIKPKSTLKLSASTNVNKLKDKPPNHIPFHEFIKERQKTYEKKPWKIDPPIPDYKPVGVGTSVAKSKSPANAILRRQKYRHVDDIEFTDTEVFAKFKRDWEESGMNTQRAAFLIGRYKRVTNPLKIGHRVDDDRWPKEILRALVLAHYEPNQIHEPWGVIFQQDDMLEKAIVIAKAIDMEVVGWMITSEERGDIILSGREVIQASRMQNKFKNFGKYSRIVTVVVYPGMNDPCGYMISDQGCALKKHGLIKLAPDNYGMIRASELPKNLFCPTINVNKMDVKQGQDFKPNKLIVSVSVAVTENSNQTFRFSKFPHPVREAKPNILRAYLKRNIALPYHFALSDFYLLLYLTKHMDMDIVIRLAAYVAKRQRVDVKLQTALECGFRGI